MIATESFKETFRLLGRMPLLWVPGLIGGALAAGLWLLLNMTGAFFTSRILILAGLILFVFLVGMLALIKDSNGDLRAMVQGGIRYYFPVLLPLLVILFTLVIIFFLLFVTFGFVGIAPDPGSIGLLTFCVMIPTLMLTFFFDMAAVFEDRKVFESIQRSIVLVSTNTLEVVIFFLISALAAATMLFSLMIVWEIALFEKLEPLTHYNETQMQAITAEQLMGMISPDGLWVTAIVLFLGCLLLIPLLCTYKACFYRKLATGPAPGSVDAPIQQIGGEYDSKGRWYKY
jgi:hypothetical protein